MSDFKNQVAVITGAASGIGRGIAEKFIHEGMKVVLSDIETKVLKKTENELKEISSDIISITTDVSKPEDVNNLARKTLEHFGKVNILCNNAGVGFANDSAKSIWESTLPEWDWILGVNVWGVIHGIHAFVPIMLNQDTESYIINTASITSLMTPSVGASLYCITKHTVIAISEALKSELARIGSKIKVIALCPGFVSTNLISSDRNYNKQEPLTKSINPEMEPLLAAYRHSIENGISPFEVGEILFNNLDKDKFYIPTDRIRYLRRSVQHRMNSILKDLQN